MSDHQVIVTTHDERFFLYLKDQLDEKTWQFKRILKLDKKHGPRISNHKVSDDMIESLFLDGKSAANEMRQAEEEWLLGSRQMVRQLQREGICVGRHRVRRLMRLTGLEAIYQAPSIARDFGVNVRIREVERAYLYDRSELAVAIGKFLKEIDRIPPSVPGVFGRFTDSIQRGVVENCGSHFSDNEYGTGSIGDEEKRWEEFKSFRKIFICKSCKGKKFKRPEDLKIPLCAKPTCQKSLSFKEG